MPKAACTRPRAPAEANGRRRSIGSGSWPCSVSMRFTAAARSGAVSASVPSKSNRTARLDIAAAAQKIVDVAVAPEPIALADRVVGHADELLGPQPAGAGVARELGGLDEAQIVVRAPGQKLQHVLGADDREEVGLGIAVDGGKEYLPARAHEARAGRDHALGLRHMLQQLHARDDIELARVHRRIFL